MERLLLEVSYTQAFLDAQQHFGSRREGRGLALQVEGKAAEVVIGENTFTKALPPNLRRMTKRQESCGCMDHIKAYRLQDSVNRFRRKHAKVRGYKPYDHKTPYDALSRGGSGRGRLRSGRRWQIQAPSRQMLDGAWLFMRWHPQALQAL